MNGQPLPVEHGFPVRLIAPGMVRRGQRQWLTRHRGDRPALHRSVHGPRLRHDPRGSNAPARPCGRSPPWVPTGSSRARQGRHAATAGTRSSAWPGARRSPRSRSRSTVDPGCPRLCRHVTDREASHGGSGHSTGEPRRRASTRSRPGRSTSRATCNPPRRPVPLQPADLLGEQRTDHPSRDASVGAPASSVTVIRWNVAYLTGSSDANVRGSQAAQTESARRTYCGGGEALSRPARARQVRRRRPATAAHRVGLRRRRSGGTVGGRATRCAARTYRPLGNLRARQTAEIKRCSASRRRRMTVWLPMTTRRSGSIGSPMRPPTRCWSGTFRTSPGWPLCS